MPAEIRTFLLLESQDFGAFLMMPKVYWWVQDILVKLPELLPIQLRYWLAPDD